MKSKTKQPFVTVYTVCHNYGRFLAQAIDSVLSQSFKDWELLIFDDGSTDNTLEVANRYSPYPNIRIFSQKKQGLIATCNHAIEEAKGKYLLRLDADDYLDENALLILTQTMKNQPDLAMVYPDYFIVNEENTILEHVRQNPVGHGTEVMDLPAHGACSLVSRKVFFEINKYSTENSCQDGYDLWLKLIGKYKVKNINLPLFYYRQHGQNLTSQEHRILDNRRLIKGRHVKNKLKDEKYPEVLAIIPSRAIKLTPSASPFREIAGKKLIDYTLEAATQAEHLSRTVVVSEDQKILDYAKSNSKFECIKRPANLGGLTSRIQDTVLWTLEQLEKKEKYRPDFVMILYIHTPLRKATHIDEAIYSQMIFKTDSVISVTQNTKFLYRHDSKGMIPLYKKRLLRHEKDILYEENGAIEMSRVDSISKNNFLGKTIGHILMSRRDSLQIMNDFDFWMTEQILNERSEHEMVP